MAGPCLALRCRLPSERQRTREVGGRATVHVAVPDPLPAYRHGVATMLAGIRLMVEQPTGVIEWVNTRPDGAILLTLHSAEDLELLTALCRVRPRPLIIAPPAREVPTTGMRAVRVTSTTAIAAAEVTARPRPGQRPLGR